MARLSLSRRARLIDGQNGRGIPEGEVDHHAQSACRMGRVRGDRERDTRRHAAATGGAHEREMLPGGDADAFQGPQLAEGGHAVIVAVYWPPLAFTFNVF